MSENIVKQIIEVRFVNSVDGKETLSKKTYAYILSDSILFSKVKTWCWNKNDICYRKYDIETNASREYSNPVVIVGNYKKHISDKSELMNYITISSLKFAGASTIIVDKKEDEKEEKENRMNNLMGNIEFGKVNDVKMSMYGPAFETHEYAGYVSYDNTNKEWVDVTGLIFDFGFAYKMPVSISDIKENDFIKHNNAWARVIAINETSIEVEKTYEKEVASIIPTKNMFGFNFVTKLMYIGFDSLGGTPDNKNPFGSLLPIMMLKEGDTEHDMLPLMLMMSQNSDTKFDFNNPMMMYMMMKDDSNSSDMLPLMLMMNQSK